MGQNEDEQQEIIKAARYTDKIELIPPASDDDSQASSSEDAGE